MELRGTFKKAMLYKAKSENRIEIGLFIRESYEILEDSLIKNDKNSQISKKILTKIGQWKIICGKRCFAQYTLWK